MPFFGMLYHVALVRTDFVFLRSCNKSRRIRWTEHVARIGAKRNVYMLLVRKPEGKIPLGRPRHRWVDKVKIDHVEIALGDVDWIGLAQSKENVESSCERGDEPSGSIKRWETIE
jgi:hypothetical protein